MNPTTLELIIGPMYSGKSTELLRRLSVFASNKFNHGKILYVNAAITIAAKSGLTHSSSSPSSPSSKGIIYTHRELLAGINIRDFKIIGIDEAQFFPDLIEFCELAEKEKTKMIVAGLSGSFDRKPIGKIIDLIPLCDDITRLYALCRQCGIKPAIFSQRLSDSKEEILIGSDMEYQPVCRRCYQDEYR
jgi:thymidine kinase